MSGTLPTTPAPTYANLQSMQPTRVSEAQNLRRVTRSVGAHRWGWKLGWRVLAWDEAAPIVAFLIAQRGRAESWQMIAPGPHKAPLGIATGSPLTANSAQTGRSIATQGWSPSTAGILKAGDFVKFSSHSKVYMVTADAASDSHGNATLAIEPSLMQAVTGDSLIVTAVPFTMALAADNLDNALSAQRKRAAYDFEITVVESF